MFDVWMSVMVGGGTAGWLFFQLNRRSGMANSGGNLVAAGIVGALVFLVAFTLLKYVFHIS